MADILSDGMRRDWKSHSALPLPNHYGQTCLNFVLFESHPLVNNVTTVGKFQVYRGDVIILTLAASSVGIFDNLQRQYVALSRSCSALIVIGNIKPYLENPCIQCIMLAQLALSKGETIIHAGHHGVTELSTFAFTPPSRVKQPCVICTTSMLQNSTF